MKVAAIRSFDGLRGFAILAVMLFHGSYGYFPGGFLGVDLFFVVSGYLITSLLYAEHVANHAIAFDKFYARRVLRLLPALLIGILLGNLLWDYTELSPGHNRSVATFAGLFYFTNMVFDYVCGNMNHLWSLSVEEHFYFVWPVTVAFVLFRLSNRNKILMLGILILACEIFRVVAFRYQHEWVWGIFWIDPYGFTLCRMDGILLGALLYFVGIERPRLVSTSTRFNSDNLWLIILCIVLLALGLRLSLYDPVYLQGGFLFTNIVCTAIVLLAVRNPDHPILSHPVVRWIGNRSYGIYLYHFPIFLFLERFRIADSFSNLLIVTCIRFISSFAFAALSYTYIEQPILRYKNRFKVRLNMSH